MAIVGDAFVRVRVISSSLSNDIADSVRDGFRRASADMDSEGERAGRRAGAAAGRGIKDETIKGAKGTGERVAEDLGGTFRERLLRDIRTQLPKRLQGGLRNAFRDGFRDLKNITPASVGQGISNSIRNSVRRGLSSLTPEKDFDFKAFRKAGSDMSKSLHEGFSLGIGRARMGKAVLSALLLAAPSMISGAAAIGGAMASEIVTLLSAIGPGLGGALGVAAAGFATLALNAGLLMAAFKAGNPELDAAKKSLGEVAKQLGTPIAAGMAAGFVSFVESLRSILPQINDLLGQTGEAFGRMFASLGQTLSSAENLVRIREILSNNVTFIDNFSRGVNGLATSFLILFAAAKPFIDYIGQGVARFGEWAAASLAVSEGNGNLASFMDRMLAKFQQLLSVIVDFGVGIGNVFSAASKAGEGLLQRISGIGERFRAWTSDTGNQARMTAFFEKMDVLSQAVMKTFGQLFSAGGKALENFNMQPLLDFLNILGTSVGPAIAAVFREIKEGAGPNLLAAFTNLGTALQKVADSGMVQLIAQGISSIVLAASEFINTDFGSFLFSIMVPLGLFGGLISTVIGPISALVSVIGTLATAGLLPLAAIIGGIIGTFVLMYTNSENLRNALGNLGGVIQEHVVAAFEKIKPLIGPLIDAVLRLASALGDKLAGAINFLAPIIGYLIDKLGVIFEYIIKQVTTMINFITAILTGDWSAAWGYAVQAVQNVWELLQGLFGDIVSAIGDWIGGIGEKIGAGWEAVETKTSEIWNGILDWLSGIWDSITTGIGDWISNMTSGLSEGFSSIGTTISDAWNGITTFFSDLWNGITEGVSGFWGGLVNIFQSSWNNLMAFIEGFGQGFAVVWNVIWQTALIPLKITWNIIKLIWTAIQGFLFAAWEKIKSFAVTIWTGITTFFSTVWDGVKAVAETVWDAITSFLSSVWEGISSVATTIWTGITSFFSTVWDGVTSAFTTVWTVITDALAAAWDAIVAAAQTIWGVLVEFFTTMWDGVTAVFTDVWTAITDFLTTAWTGIQSIATTIWTGISTFFSTIWAGIQTVFTTVVTAIQAFLSAAWEGISSVVSSVWSAISAFFSTIWNAIWTTISTLATNIMTFLQGIWDQITSAVSSAWDAISGLASELWGNVVSTIEDIVGPIVGTLQGWWDDISSAVSRAWDGLSGTVGEIWNGIKDAIVQPIEDAWKALTGWAEDIGKVISGITGAVSTAYEDVTAKVTTMLQKAADANAAGAALAVTQGLNGGVPGAAEGAIVPPIPGGWNMIVGEGKQTERIEPLDRQGLSRRDRALISHLAGQMGGGAVAAGGAGQIAVNVNLDGNLLGRFIESIVVDQQSLAGRRAARNRRA